MLAAASVVPVSPNGSCQARWHCDAVTMDCADYSDAALVLVGHGSTLNADSSSPTHRHADWLRGQRVFRQVVECFWKEEPSICGVLRGVWAPRVFIVPLFISDGYFTEQVIPRELGFCKNGQADFPRSQVRGAQILHYCGPVGTHESMTMVLLDRASKVVKENPRPDNAPFHESRAALVIAGHGTSNNENSRKAIENQVERIRATGRYAEVYAAFMEEDPKIQQIYTMARSSEIVMVPFFISDGLHSFEDIPMMLGESETDVRSRLLLGQPTWINPTERQGKWVWYSRSIGNEPGITDVILGRVREMATGNTNSK
jgi:sirohydrochlorin cobaltochelatase